MLIKGRNYKYGTVSSWEDIHSTHNGVGVDSDSRPHLLLDLDATVICALSMNKELEYMPENYQEKFSYSDMGDYYRIFERPYLQVFLDYAFANFNISIFTAADKDYAVHIADNIILNGNANRKLQYLFHGYHGVLADGIYNGAKDLRLLWEFFSIPGMTKNNTIILDDLYDVYEANPSNTIRAPPFEIINNHNEINYNAIHDNWLISIIPLLDIRRSYIMNNRL